MGTDIDVGIVVGNVTSLGAFQFTANVDPTILQPIGASPGSFLGSTGRTVLCTPANLGSASAQLSCGTLGGAPPPAPAGSGVIATARFHVVAAGTSPITLTSTILTDLNGIPYSSTLEAGGVSATIVTPTPCPGACPTATFTATPSPTPTPTPISCAPVAGSATMCLIPQSQTVTAGSTFTIKVVVDQASNIGSYEFRLTYNGVLISAVTAADGGFLGSSGRTVVCPSPILAPGSIDFACATIGSSPPGPTAPGLLANVTFTAAVTGATSLHFAKSTLSDPLANPIAVTPADGSVSVQ